MEKTITMKLSEYEKLNNENKAMKEILNKKESIGFEFRSDIMGMGYIRNSWNIITKDELILELLKNIKAVESEKNSIYRELSDLRNKIFENKKKSWF